MLDAMTSRLAGALLIIGLLITTAGAALVFPRRHGSGFIMNIDTALPWTGAITLVGAVVFAVAYSAIPRSWVRGPVLALFMAGVTAVALAIACTRLHWPGLWWDTGFGLVALTAAILVNLGAALASWVAGRRARMTAPGG